MQIRTRQFRRLALLGLSALAFAGGTQVPAFFPGLSVREAAAQTEVVPPPCSNTRCLSPALCGYTTGLSCTLGNRVCSVTYCS